MLENDNREQSFYRMLAMTVSLIFLFIIVLTLLGATGVYSLPFSEPLPEGEMQDNGYLEDEGEIIDESYADENPPETVSLSAVTTSGPQTTEEDIPPMSEEPIDSDVELSVPLTTFDPGEVNLANAVVSPRAEDYPETILAVSEDAGGEYLSRIIFLGDSTTYGLRRYKMLGGGLDTKQVWTPVSGTLTLSQAGIAKILYPETGKEITIAEAVQDKKPDIMIITLGVNGVSFMQEDYFKQEYLKLVETIQSISPDTKIILQSIFPIARSYAKQQSINNTKINAANDWIVSVAHSAKVRFLDTATALADEEGYLPEELQNGDGMHLNEAGFKIELDYIRTHALPESDE